MLLEEIAGHVVTAQPSVDAHVLPNDGVGHASHADLPEFGWV
jgi:hypothetical protein